MPPFDRSRIVRSHVGIAVDMEIAPGGDEDPAAGAHVIVEIGAARAEHHVPAGRKVDVARHGDGVVVDGCW